MLPILQVGPLAIQTPGLILLLGVWIGLSIAERHANRRGVNPNLLYNLAFIGLIAGLIGARLTYVVRFPAAFSASPASLISINPGLLDPLGGIAFGVLGGSIYGQRKNLSLWPTLDALTPTFATMAIAIRLSTLAAGSAFGSPTNLPWGIDLWGERRHPSQIYAMIAAVLILRALWPGKERFPAQPPGLIFITFIALTAGARLFLEGFRGDSLLLPNGIRSVQVIAWIILAASLWGYRKIKIVNGE
jgi:prolipoprotein diacylglyceryltransferase